MILTFLSRRTLLKAAGALTLTFAIPLDAQGAELNGSLAQFPRLSAWLRIEADGTVMLMIGKVELGQGIVTAVRQICADELDVDLNRVTVISGDTAVTPDEGVTAGSMSMPQCGRAVRQAAAEARWILVNIAAERLAAPVEALSVRDGVVRGPESEIAYQDLVTGSELQQEATGTRPYKQREAYRYIGRSVEPLHLRAKVMGQPVFVQDLRADGLLHGRVVRPPTYDAALIAVDAAPVRAMPGILQIVRDGSFLGLIAEREEQAIAAAEALSVLAEWSTTANSLPHQADVFDWLRAQTFKTTTAFERTRSDDARVVQTLRATYRRPYQMHASIGPSAAVALMTESGNLTVDTHSQSVFWTAESIAKMLRMDPARVRLRHVHGAGCYGHNLADDAAADAALLARAVIGRTVRLQYSRADEHRWEPYGSAMIVETEADLDRDGNVLDWRIDVHSTPHNTRPMREAGYLLPARYLSDPFPIPEPRNIPAPGFGSERNAIVLYEFPGHRVRNHFTTAMPLRVSALRGLGAYANVFATESFVDEVAHAVGADPVAYRLRLMSDERARDVIRTCAEAFGWEEFQRRPGHGRGIGFARYKNLECYTCVAIEVAVNDRGDIRVIRVVAANDSGEIVHPGSIEQQIEGGIVQSLSWSLREEVAFDSEKILTAGWSDYPILRFSEIPPVEVVQINRPGQPFLGTGEGSQGPTVAALANAVFDATRRRLRQLPFTPERVRGG